MDATGQKTVHGTSAGDDVATQLGRLQDELSAIKKAVSDFGKAPRAEASGACNCTACAAAAHQLAQHAKQEARTAISELEGLARKNPGYAVGGALGVGLVLGLLLHRH